MEIRIADKAGFCFGVKRAVDMAIEYTESHDKLLSLGQLIHNDQVSERLASNGLIEIDTLQGHHSEAVLIRSHGVGKEVYDIGKQNDIQFIEATCPYVKKVHKIVDKHHNEGFKIIIVGNSKHPEIMGINGWCDNTALVIADASELPDLDDGNYCVVAQTTLKLSTWEGVVEKINQMSLQDVKFFNTICSATAERQAAAMELAPQVDLMIVIGGYHSSNTRKLYEICKKLCNETIHVEKKSDLMMTNYNKYGIIGITAGASTPDWVIQEIYDFLKNQQ